MLINICCAAWHTWFLSSFLFECMAWYWELWRSS